jgi:hypothetical protein
MKTIFLGGLGRYGMGQGGFGVQNMYSNPYSWNIANNGLTPEQNLLQQNAAAGSGAPQNPGGVPGLPGAMAAAGGDCYTCSNGSDIQSVQGAAAAAALRAKGYSCRKSECESQGPGFGGLAQFGGVAGMPGGATMAPETMFSSDFSGQGFANLPGSVSASFMGARQVKLVRRPGF